jgi:hypothetical protein
MPAGFGFAEFCPKLLRMAVLVDTNTILDCLTLLEPFALESAAMIS